MKLAASSLFVMGWFFIAQPNAHADEITVQVTPADPNTIVDTSTVTSIINVQSIETKINDAQTNLNSASQIQGDAIITTIQSNVPNIDTQTAISIATTQEPIKTAVESATAVIQQANSAIQSAQTALQTAVIAQTNVDTQTAVVESATASVANAQTFVNISQENVIIAQASVDSQTVNVSTNQTVVDSATAVVAANTSAGLSMTVYQDTGYNNRPPMGAGVLKYTITDTNGINEQWGGGGPANVIPEDFQVRWQGIWTPQYTGTQWIYAPADDGARLYLDGQLVIDDWYDKGGGGSTAAVATTAGVGKTFDFWYYENGGGANVALMRYNGNGTWSVIPASEFSTSSATPEQKAALSDAINNLQTSQQNLTIANENLTNFQQNLTIANENLTNAQQNLTIEQGNLTNSQQNLTISLQTADSLANVAITKVNDAVTAMTNAVQVTVNYYAEQQRIAAENARIAAEQAAAQARAEALAAQQAAQAAAEAAAKALAEKAAAEAAAKALADQQAADAAKAKAEAEALAAQQAADAKAAQDKADAEAKAAQDAANAKAAADAKAAAQAAADKAAADAKAAADKAAQDAANKAAEQAKADQAAKDAQAKADAAKAEQAAKDKAIADAIGVKPNNPDQLSDTIVKEAPKEVLVAHVQVDKAGVENGGIEFFGTKSAPQVVGEDGKLTPPAPPPGSGLPIPPDAITTADTFIGQPGGTTFNAPDIAVPVILVPLDGAIAAVPGAEALNQAFVAMSNIGNDMSPVTRKKAKKILVLTVAVAAIRRRFGS